MFDRMPGDIAQTLWSRLSTFCMIFVADGVVSYLGITGRPALAAIVTVSYLGPRGLEVAILSGFGRNRDRL